MLNFIGDFSPMCPYLDSDTQNSDFDRSVKRIVKQEDRRAEAEGFSVTRQGQAIRLRYRNSLRPSSISIRVVRNAIGGLPR
jgi:hypothetical protein